MENDIRSLIRERNLGQFVFLMGDIQDIFRFIKYVDALLLPSISNEDLPNVISEAMAFGKPVIASDLAGIPEQVYSGVNGILCTPGKIEDFSKAINLLRLNRSLRNEYGENSRKLYEERFTPVISTAKYKLEYDSLL
jgi:glycosyltransferase involved in cell wall biosynthesis